MKMTKKWLALIILGVALVVTSVSYAQSSPSMGTSISPASSLPGGAIAEITPLQDVFTVSRGAAKKQSDIKLYKITLGNPEYSHQIRIMILNLDNVSEALRNPNSYYDLFIYYATDHATWQATADEDRAKYGNVFLVRDTGAKATARLSRVVGEVRLQPSVLNQTELYIIAEAVIPHGKGEKPGEPEPPAVPALEFHAEVRM